MDATSALAATLLAWLLLATTLLAWLVVRIHSYSIVCPPMKEQSDRISMFFKLRDGTSGPSFTLAGQGSMS